ncbi:MAG: DUF302 domain-containing protein [Gammaproteobacteria bacterium]
MSQTATRSRAPTKHSACSQRRDCRHVFKAHPIAGIRNPALGTPLIQCAQTIGIDLPQKVLVYKDADRRVMIAYNDSITLLSATVTILCVALLS